MKLPKFLIGLLVGTAVGLIIWYWQKSTSAEEGALAVLDRLAAAEGRVRELEGRLRLAQEQRNAPQQPELLSGLSHLWGLESAAAGTELAKGDSGDASPENGIVAESAEDDLQLINGIGPTYERRLKEAGIRTFADVAGQTPETLRSVSGLKTWQSAAPEEWIDEARSLAGE